MIDYQILSDAKGYYEGRGYTYVEAPWAVDPSSSAITMPKDRTDVAFLKDKVLVASGEQSFLQMIRDNAFADSWRTEFMCITPCFRDEKNLDDLHQLYFMKLELINLEVNPTSLQNMIGEATRFFEQYLDTDVIQLNENEFDIVASNTKIELGSYGIRTHPLVGSWVYGTGVAEPRLSTAIIKDNK